MVATSQAADGVVTVETAVEQREGLALGGGRKAGRTTAGSGTELEVALALPDSDR